MSLMERGHDGLLGQVMLIGVKTATLVYFAFHFGLTLLYVGPINPLKIQTQRIQSITIGAFFPQNWSFFAPNPVATNQALLIHCVNHNEVGIPTADWYDVSSPLIRRHQQQRFSAYDRLDRPQANAVRDYISGGPNVTPLMKGCRNGSKAACEALTKFMEESHSYNGIILQRVASCFCKQASPAATEALLRYRESAPREWRKRFDPLPPPIDRDIGRVPLDANVVDAGFYLRP
jgi:hypothetical protein